ncbi:hypothetical protein 8F11_33 [uncultured Caudovirales phage]|uniref:Protein NrdI n=1 Tax=uncultured Caudovirales phage TaxID=2100421 RepID=A0A2H4J6X7_9CAUD|nr:hypothetical protein 8F11_33 [uncultured Caudovirales phage]
MKVYYASMTGNVRRFIAKTGVDAINIKGAPIPTEPFVLVTYTFGFGDIPAEVDAWLTHNYKLLRGVAVSGNRNWGDNYGLAGDKISHKYGVPLILKFEQAGTPEDIRLFKERLAIICATTN